jgi:hypothetical protein
VQQRQQHRVARSGVGVARQEQQRSGTIKAVTSTRTAPRRSSRNWMPKGTAQPPTPFRRFHPPQTRQPVPVSSRGR